MIPVENDPSAHAHILPDASEVIDIATPSSELYVHNLWSEGEAKKPDDVLQEINMAQGEPDTDSESPRRLTSSGELERVPLLSPSKSSNSLI